MLRWVRRSAAGRDQAVLEGELNSLFTQKSIAEQGKIGSNANCPPPNNAHPCINRRGPVAAPMDVTDAQSPDEAAPGRWPETATPAETALSNFSGNRNALASSCGVTRKGEIRSFCVSPFQ